MSDPSIQDSFGSQAGHAIDYMPEHIRLQQEVNDFTHKLEHKKSELVIIEEQIRQTLDELTERQKNIQARKPSDL